jgi:hypothetical protein
MKTEDSANTETSIELDSDALATVQGGFDVNPWSGLPGLLPDRPFTPPGGPGILPLPTPQPRPLPWQDPIGPKPFPGDTPPIIVLPVA